MRREGSSVVSRFAPTVRDGEGRLALLELRCFAARLTGLQGCTVLYFRSSLYGK